MHYSLLSLGNSTLQYSIGDCELIRDAYKWFGGIKRRCRSYIYEADPEIAKIDTAINNISVEKFILSTTGPVPFDNNLMNIEPVDGSGWETTTVIDTWRNCPPCIRQDSALS